MARVVGGGGPRYTAYSSVGEYNTAYPDAPMPEGATARNVLRSYTCAGAGLVDDLTASEKNHTLDFLPGGAPEPGEPDRIGTVIATRWGNPPYLVLAEKISLRQAWETITTHWPAELSSAVGAMSPVNDRSSSGIR